jgi:hypothetical protein
MATLRLTTEQQALIIRLARPLPVRIRDRFYLEAGLLIARLPECGDGAVYRAIAALQKQYFDAPILDGADDG